MPRIALLSTGSEILQGLYPDLNAQYMAAELTGLGYAVVSIAAAPDDKAHIVEAMRNAFGRADFLITTGGLGPTADDLQREAVAELFVAPLREDEQAWAMIEAMFERRGRKAPESNRVQALIPEGAHTLYNRSGTAPGFLIEPTDDRPGIACMPGPPNEMKRMFHEQVLPYLLEAHSPGHLQDVLQIYIGGKTEAEIDQQIRDLFNARPDVTMGILASGGLIKARMTLRAADEEALDALRKEMTRAVLERVGEENVWGYDSDTLEGVVGAMLRELGWTIVVAESCTGGLVNAALTEVAGASKYLRRGYIVYANEAKRDLLGVSRDTLAAHGAVSEETVREMAEGALRASGADIALAITGIAGPDGGTPDKPVGTVWFAAATKTGTEAIRYQLPGDRALVRRFSVIRALDLARRRLLREFTP